MARPRGEYKPAVSFTISRRNGMAAAKGKIVWVGRVISVLPVLAFLFSAFMKLKGGPEVSKGFAHLGLPEPMIVPLAILELSCVAIYLIPATSVLGAVLLAGYIGGAICTHWRGAAPFLSPGVIGVPAWLRFLHPLRRPTALPPPSHRRPRQPP